jgi:hypothetical protein
MAGKRRGGRSGSAGAKSFGEPQLGTAIKTSPLKCHQSIGQRRSLVELRLVGVGQKRYPGSKEVFSAKGQARAFSESRWTLKAEGMAAAILMWRRP